MSEGEIKEERGMGFRIHTFISGNLKEYSERHMKNILNPVVPLRKAGTLK